jgi:polar amino acid transport system substrate-binding protein
MFRYVQALPLCISVALLVLLFIACGAETVVIATDGEYHPFNFINETTGEIDGLERELGDELCSRAGLECEWVVNDWKDMIPDLQAEEFDVIMAGMSITTERDQLIDFTEPYYPPSPSVYLARAGANDQAADGAVGAHEQTIHSDYFQAKGRSYRAFEDPVTSLAALIAGEIDALLVDRGYAIEKLNELEGQLAIVGPEVPLDQGLGIGVRDGSDLREKFNEGIAAMKEDGSLNDLLRKWIGEDTDTF